MSGKQGGASSVRARRSSRPAGSRSDPGGGCPGAAEGEVPGRALPTGPREAQAGGGHGGKCGEQGMYETFLKGGCDFPECAWMRLDGVWRL